MKIERNLGLALVFPLLASGCFEIEDLKSVQAADASPQADASTQPDASSGTDASAQADASDNAQEGRDASLQEDASDNEQEGRDASLREDASLADAQTPPPAPCSPASCGEGQLCAPSGACMARCDAAGVCVVATTTRWVTAVMADGPVLYVALAATQDRFGNQAPDAELRTLVGDGELTLLTTTPENAERLESHGEHVYWTGTRPDTTSKKLRRVSKRAVSGPEALYAGTNITGDVVFSDTQVAFRKGDGIYVGSLDGATELRKVQDCPAVAPDQPDFCFPKAFSGDSLFYLRADVPTANDNNPSALSSINLVTMDRQEHGRAYYETKFLAVQPPYVYLPMLGGTAQVINRRDLRDLTVPDFAIWVGLSPYYGLSDGRAIQLRGDWVYLLASEYVFGNGENRKRLVFERMAATGPVNVQSILPDTFGTPLTDQYMDFALTDSHAFLAVRQTSSTGTLGSLVYRIPLPR